MSNFVWQARMTIANVTAEENYKDHYIIVSNRYLQLTDPQLRLRSNIKLSFRDSKNQEQIEIREDFDVSVGGLTVTMIIVIVVVLLIAIILGR